MEWDEKQDMEWTETVGILAAGRNNIPVSAKWKWLFRLQHDTYASGNKILKASVGIYLSGYIAAIIELLIFFFAVFSGCLYNR